MKSLIFGNRYIPPTPAILHLTADDVIIYPPDTKQLPYDLTEWCNRCIEIMHIVRPPSIAIVKDDAWESRKRSRQSSAQAIDPYNVVLIPESTAQKIAEGHAHACYVLCHEMGHIKQYQALEHVKLNRRTLLTGMAASTMAGGWAGKIAGQNIAETITDDNIARHVGCGTGLLMGGVTAATLFFSAEYYESLLERRSEFYADKMAAKVFGNDIFRILIEDFRAQTPFDVLMDGLMEVRNRAAIAQAKDALQKRYGEFLAPNLIDTLAQYAVKRKFDFENQPSMDKAVSKKGAYPHDFDRIMYLLEDAVCSRHAQASRNR